MHNYSPGDPSVEIAGLDVDGTAAMVTVNFGPFAESQNQAAIDQVTVVPDSGLAQGDGATPVVKAGMSVTPPAPTVSGFLVTAWLWVDGAEVGSTQGVRFAAKMGNVIEEVPLRLPVVQGL